jgi:hypothetical protein
MNTRCTAACLPDIAVTGGFARADFRIERRSISPEASAALGSVTLRGDIRSLIAHGRTAAQKADFQ